MLNNKNNTAFIDLLFTLVLIFVALFCLSFLLISETRVEKTENVRLQTNILVTMQWEENIDMDVWLLLPSGSKVGYSAREIFPAHLDSDIRNFRWDMESADFIATRNEERIIIDGIYPGEYVVNTLLYATTLSGKDPFPVRVTVYDVENATLIYSGERIITSPRQEDSYVSFTVEKDQNLRSGYRVVRIFDDRPIQFIGGDDNASLPH